MDLPLAQITDINSSSIKLTSALSFGILDPNIARLPRIEFLGGLQPRYWVCPRVMCHTTPNLLVGIGLFTNSLDLWRSGE